MRIPAVLTFLFRLKTQACLYPGAHRFIVCSSAADLRGFWTAKRNGSAMLLPQACVGLSGPCVGPVIQADDGALALRG